MAQRTKTKKPPQIGFRATEAQHEAVFRIARMEGYRSASHLLRDLVRALVKQRLPEECDKIFPVPPSFYEPTNSGS